MISSAARVLPLLLVLACAGPVLACAGPAATTPEPAGPDTPLPPTASDAQAGADAWLTARQGEAGAAAVALESRELAALFPSASFFAVAYAQWPLAVQPPEGLASSNLLVVEAGGAIRAITSREGLDAFFAARFAGDAVFAGAIAERAARAYLQLVQALVQDGYYDFEIVEASGAAGEGSARALVTRGGNGELRARLRLVDGALVVELVSELSPGPRPRCHATKLLDPDPIVRQIVTDDLLFMGPAARAYLLEQRARAAPALQQAIDALLAEIERRARARR